MAQSTPQGNNTTEIRDSGKSIGVALRTARLDSGMSVADVSHTLRISKDFIKMLEASEFNTLPSPTYVAGYIRSYGAAVGIEPKDIAALVKAYFAQLEDGAATPSYKFPIGDQRPRRSGALAASIAVLVAVGGYTGWYLMDRPKTIDDVLTESSQNTQVTAEIESTMTEGGALGGGADARLDQIASIDDEDGGYALPALEAAQNDTQSNFVANLSLIDETRGGGVNVAVVDPDGRVKLSLSPASDITVSEDVMREADMAHGDPVGADASTGIRTGEQPALVLNGEVQTASAVHEAVSVMPHVGGEGAQELQPDQGSAIANQRDPANEVTLRAHASSWVEIVRNDGEEVMTGLMRAGDIYLIDASDSLYLSTGNAGGLEFVFNDGTVKEVGEIGEIVRDLPLVISRLKARL